MNRRIVAIPASLVETRLVKDGDDVIAVIMKKQHYGAGGCGLRHKIYIHLPVPLSGGYRLFPVESFQNREALEYYFENLVKKYYEGASLDKWTHARITPHGLIIANTEKNSLYLYGDFSFAWLEDRFKPVQEEATHVLTTVSSECWSRSWSAEVEILNEDELDYVNYSATYCRIGSNAIATIIAPVGKVVKVRRKKGCPYRGGSRDDVVEEFGFRYEKNGPFLVYRSTPLVDENDVI